MATANRANPLGFPKLRSRTMELPDITQLTEQQWDQLIAAIQQAKVAKEIERQQEAEALVSGIGDAVQTVTDLLGPENPTAPALTSLREVRLYTAAEMGANTGLAHTLAFQAIEILAEAVRDIAIYVGSSE